MVIAIILLSATVIILLTLYFSQCQSIKQLTEELGTIPGGNSNELLHSHGTRRNIRALTEEINTLLRELRRTQIHYRRKSHDLEQMMTNISHDLRTPLTSALGYIGMLQNSDLPEAEKARELAIVEKRLLRLEELLDAFFEFSEVISGDKLPEKEPLNLIGVLEESVSHYFDDYSARERSIHLSYPQPKLSLSSNRNMLLRVFDNLIGNAYKHGSGDLRITVEQDARIRIHFENTLVDPNLEIDKVFDEFYTTDISRTKGHTGLGLAIAKQFVLLCGGEITAEHECDTFTVTVVL